MKKILVLFVLGLLPACDWFGKPEAKISPIIKRERELETFDELKVAGNFMITLSKSDHEKIVMEAPEEALSAIGVQVQNAELTIYMDDATMQVERPIVVHVYYKDMSEIDIAGSVILKADHLRAPQLDLSAAGASQIMAQVDTDRLEIEGSGSSKFSLAGRAKKQKMDVSGVVVYNAGNLKSVEADVVASGSASLLLHVSKKIVGELSDTASLAYKGSAKVTVGKTEGSSITKLD